MKITHTMKTAYELQKYIVVNQQEYEKLKLFSQNKNYISHESCNCCGFEMNINCGSCYNIKCEKYLRSNKKLFMAGYEYSVPVVKRMILSEIELLDFDENLKFYEKLIKIS